MISTDYVSTMARYNRWQNGNLMAVADALDEAALTAARGAFFGSIFATMNHLLWADRFWMSRIDGWTAPSGGIADSVALTPTYAAWKAERQRVDARFVEWSDRVRPAALRETLSWHSRVLGKDVTKPVALCIVHMFNHQTHHRGQIHAMLTAIGSDPGMTDLALAADGILD